MLTVALTGGIASGKSVVSDFFKSQQVTVIDADEISHQISDEPAVIAAIAKHFGEQVLNNNKIDRKKLRPLVFSNPKQRKWLEALLHPLIQRRMLQLLQNSTSPYSVIVIPLKISDFWLQQVDKVLVIDIDENTQISRVIARDNCSAAEAEKIILAQPARTDRLQIADDVIVNNGTIDELLQQAQKLHQHYSQLAATQK